MRAVDLPKSADVVVVGGGIIGLTIARELAQRQPDAKLVVIDKEPSVGAHASSRNSGVLHAGFYYAAESLKARLTRDGNRRLAAWCEEHGIPVRRCGKLVVARSEAEHPVLDELLRRAHANDVVLEDVSEEDAQRLEPNARTVGRALYSPSTGLVDPRAVMSALADECARAGVHIATNTAWHAKHGEDVLTNRGAITAGFVVNAAGLHADRIAHAFGVGRRYRIVPFKGVYLYGNERAPELRMHVYPVPELGMPFLGVHLTLTVSGGVKIGPTAQPALWREAYGPIWSREALKTFSLRDLAGVIAPNMRLLANASTRRYAWTEARKAFRSALVRDAAMLARGVTLDGFDRWGPPGIRAQLYDRERGELVMDFLYESDDRSLHVLNAEQ